MPTCAYALYLGRLSSNSRKSIQSQFNTIGRTLHWPQDEIPARIQIVDYQSAMQCRSLMVSAGMAARSVNRAMIALKGLLKVSALVGKIDQMQLLQIQSIPNLKHGEHTGSPLTAEQAVMLLNKLKAANSVLDTRNSAIVAVLLGTGLRRSEIAGLKLQDFDDSEKCLFVAKGKGNKSRTVFIPAWTQHFLRIWLETRGNSDGYLFCGLPSQFNQVVNKSSPRCHLQRSGCDLLARLTVLQKVNPVDTVNALDGSTIYRIVRKITASVGLNEVSPHDLRRTFITRLLEQNIDINTVRQLAGHANIATTSIYDKRSDKMMRNAAKNLDYYD
jgi:integrase/recombinase XerD